MSKTDLTAQNIEHAIQRAFNIKGAGKVGQMDYSGHGYEISGFAVASQEAAELNHLLREVGHTEARPYYFAPSGRWSVLNFNKIKVQWLQRCVQVIDDEGIWNVVKGTWKDGCFFPDMLSPDIKVKIIPSQGAAAAAESGTECLIPHKVYQIQQELGADTVPQVKFSQQPLQCVRPQSIMNVSINRQGIYINRKFRDKVELGSASDSPRLKKFSINIYLHGDLVSHVPDA